MRGFGVTGASNTLVLINGRRLNDIDLAGIDFSAIPNDSIERIEITRGNSGARALWRRRRRRRHQHRHQDRRRLAAIGAHPGQLLAPIAKGGNVSAKRLVGQLVGLRLRPMRSAPRLSPQQQAASAERGRRFALEQRAGDHRLSQSHRRQPASRAAGWTARFVGATINQLVTDPRGAATPFDFANKQGISATLGVTRMLCPAPS